MESKKKTVEVISEPAIMQDTDLGTSLDKAAALTESEPIGDPPSESESNGKLQKVAWGVYKSPPINPVG